MSGPLSGVRVLDVSRAIAGPFGAMILGDLGAEVIKIEAPEGDLSRFAAGSTYKGENFTYLAFNRNKKNLKLDLDTATGKEAFYELVKVSDVVLDNLRPGAMQRLGADYDALKKINPRIICASICGYGPTGPSRDRPAFDVVLLAASGILSLTREPGERPVRPSAPIGDMAGGLFAIVGILAALAERERTGRGKRIDVSLLDVCIALLSYQFSDYFCSGEVPQPLSNSGHPVSVPYGVYKTKEGYVALGSCWPRICRAIGAEWIIDDPRFNNMEIRRHHRDELNKIMEEYMAQATAKDWLNIFEAEDIPADRVKTLDEVVEDPQVNHQKMILKMEHPLGGEIRLAGAPIKAEGINVEEFTPPATLNQHEKEILVDILGYDEKKIANLRAEEKEHTEERQKHVRKIK
jgi:CoA:oxalate CoA-transferase